MSRAEAGCPTVDADEFVVGQPFALDPDTHVERVDTEAAPSSGHQHDGADSTNTGLVSVRPIHVRNVSASLVERGNGASLAIGGAVPPR